MTTIDYIEKLKRIRERCRVVFDALKTQFVDSTTGATVLGLTRILAKLIPVPLDRLDDKALAQSEARTLKPRRSKNDPLPNPAIERYSGVVLARCADCQAACEWTRDNAPSERVREQLRDERNSDRAHGSVVDYQLRLYIQCQSRERFFQNCPFVDPCVGTLIEAFDKRGWALVATQMPLYSSEMGVATAFDLVATDRATKTKLFLIEIKATRGLRSGSQDEFWRNNTQYERLRGRLSRTTLRGMPLSFYSRHQVQLFCILHMARTEHQFTFDRAVVMRVSPGIARVYELNDYYEERARSIVRAIGLKTGAVSSRKRKRPE